MMKSFIALVGVLLLAGCVEAPPGTTTPELTFAQMEPVQIDAAAVEVVDNYKPPMRAPNIEHTFHQPLYAVTDKLLHHQLTASGQQNTLRAIIEDASVVREEIPMESGVTAFFTQQEQERLKAKVLVRFELVDPKAPDIVIGHASVIANRMKTINEDASPADRDQAYFQLTEEMMNDVNDGLNSIVKSSFGKKF